MTDDPVRVERLEGGACWRVTLGGSKGNILDGALMDALTRVFQEAADAEALRAICLEGEGTHFSFGASVQEHLPDQVAGMFSRFDDLIAALLDSGVVILAAVRGQCLGGGLELVSLCHRVFASHDAKFGQPEIALGVFAPVASVVLTERVGRGAAEDLLLSGRSIDAEAALRIGLADELTGDDPAAAALAYARKHLLPHSASSLRLAVRAARMGLRARLDAELPSIEGLYLDQLMSTRDAVEGLQAFLEKRPPKWSHS